MPGATVALLQLALSPCSSCSSSKPPLCMGAAFHEVEVDAAFTPSHFIISFGLRKPPCNGTGHDGGRAPSPGAPGQGASNRCDADRP